MSSSETTESTSEISVSYNFALKWKLKGQELKVLSEKNTNGVRSDLYQFKTVEELKFYLEIYKKSLYYDEMEVHLKGSKKWFFSLVYAFVVCDGRAFHLKASNQLSFLNPCCLSSCSNVEDLTVHCMVNASYLNSPVKEEDEESVEDDNLLQKDQKAFEFEGLPDSTLFNMKCLDDVSSFLRVGRIPYFTVDLAMTIICQLNNLNCQVLKILCAEYLRENITAQNFRRIARSAIDNNLPHLERKCLEKLADGTFDVSEKKR